MKALKKQLRGKKNIVFFDLEGTQFTHEVIAIGAVKCIIDDNAYIIEEDKNTFIAYVKPKNPIGRIISELTNLSEDFIKNNGVSFEESLNMFKDFVGDIENTIFIVFGSNDARMLIESAKHSKPNNKNICDQIINNTFDFLAFISQYARDKNNNTYSLVHYLELFNGTPNGTSHNPLNDAIDLKNLYSLFLSNKDILKEQYKLVLSKNKSFPEPIKKALMKLQNNEDVTAQEFEHFIEKYLA